MIHIVKDEDTAPHPLLFVIRGIDDYNFMIHLKTEFLCLLNLLIPR